jgi:glycosyltransferase involved in cell wall biosynthesis
MKKHSTIVYCESRFAGNEHAPFNAAFISSIMLAYPDAQMVCFSGKKQQEAIRQLLKEEGCRFFGSIEWRKIDRFVKNKTYFLQMFINDFWWVAYFFKKIKNINPDLVILGTTSPLTIFLLKILSFMINRKTVWGIVLHSELCDVDVKGSRRPWHFFTSIGKILGYFQPPNMKLVLLGEPIYRTLLSIMPKLSDKKIYSIEHPYFWSVKKEQVVCRPSQEKIIFGFLGSIYKGRGYELYEKLAKKAEGLTDKATFITVGSVAPSYFRDHFARLPRQPLSFADYREQASRITYSMHLGGYSLYRLAASGSFLDSLSYVKPVIALRNPYVEYYFEKLGDIGYLCDTYEDVEKVVIDIINNFSPEKYMLQCENILNNRDLFSPEKVSRQIREIFES